MQYIIVSNIVPLSGKDLLIKLEEESMGRGRVLIVDDEEDIRKTVRLTLTKAGFDVVEAEDGEKAIKEIGSGDNPRMVDAIEALGAQSIGDESLQAYDRARRAEFSGKWKVERLVGAAVAFPALINRAANVLSRRRDMADLLVGVVGDFVPAREVLSPGYLLRLMLASSR